MYMIDLNNLQIKKNLTPCPHLTFHFSLSMNNFHIRETNMREYSFIGFALHPEEEDTDTCDTEFPPLFSILSTYLFSIKILYYFISISFV